MRYLRLFALALVAVVAMAAPAAAQYPPAGADCVIVSDEEGDETATFRQGEEVVVAGDTGCAPGGGDVRGNLHSHGPIQLFLVKAAADGSYEASPSLPSNTPTGSHTIRVIAGGREIGSKAITVTAASAGGTSRLPATGDGSGRRLPTSGGDIAKLALFALMLVLFGGSLIVATWKRWQVAKVESSYAPTLMGPPALKATETELFGAVRPTRVHDPEDLHDTGNIPRLEVASAEQPTQLLDPVLDATAFADPEAEEWAARALSEDEAVSVTAPEAVEAQEGVERVRTPKARLVKAKAGVPSSEDVLSRLEQEINAWSNPQ
ncbi:MAG TPA: hypothetical protein VNE62_08300 [Actinomycetota bacterium]|nr:hypothetical protein [Actinomycetota bacterium]